MIIGFLFGQGGFKVYMDESKLIYCIFFMFNVHNVACTTSPPHDIAVKNVQHTNYGLYELYECLFF